MLAAHSEYKMILWLQTCEDAKADHFPDALPSAVAALRYCAPSEAPQTVQRLLTAIVRWAALLPLSDEILPEAAASALVALFGNADPRICAAAYAHAASLAARTAEGQPMAAGVLRALGCGPVLRQLVVSGLASAEHKPPAAEILAGLAAKASFYEPAGVPGALLGRLAAWRAWLACYEQDLEIDASIESFLASLSSEQDVWSSHMDRLLMGLFSRGAPERQAAAAGLRELLGLARDGGDSGGGAGSLESEVLVDPFAGLLDGARAGAPGVLKGKRIT